MLYLLFENITVETKAADICGKRLQQKSKSNCSERGSNSRSPHRLDTIPEGARAAMASGICYLLCLQEDIAEVS
jgi:hypothetical protein